MDCLNCDIKEICKLYQAVKDYSVIADIVVSNCRMKRNVIETECVNELKVTSPETIIPNSYMPIVKTYNDFRQVSDQARKNRLNKESIASKVIISTEDQDTIAAQCPNCESTSTSGDFYRTCKLCEKQICINCETQTPSGSVCPECWEK